MILSCAGCGSSVTQQALDNKAKESIQHVSSGNGPVTLTATLSKSTLRLSDELTLTLAVKKSDEYQVEFPDLESLLTDFTVIDSKVLLPQLDGDFELQQRVYQLQPSKAGKLELILPPLSHFAASNSETTSEKKAAQENPDSGSQKPEDSLKQPLAFVEVEPFEIEVVSELSAQTPSLDSLRAQAEPLDLQPSRISYAVWIALGAVIVAILLAMIPFIASLRSKKSEPMVSPRDQALQELDQLAASKLAEQDVKLYYVELTAIVRRYIEGSTGVRAPEQTTEEFLREVAEGKRFQAAIVGRLQAFLESADLVKFAGRTPNSEEVTNSQTTAREFIQADLAESRSDGAAIGLNDQPNQPSQPNKLNQEAESSSSGGALQ